MPEFKQINREIFTVADFLRPQECAAFIRLAETSGFTDAPITTMFGPQLRPDVRSNTRVMIDDPALADHLWERACDYVPKTIDNSIAIGVNERFRFYRYDIGQQFDWHYDGAFRRPNGDRSRVTFMIYLNDDFEGGQTSFEDVEIIPAPGLALFFIHQLRHKGQPVTNGRKYVIRTDVMYRPNRP